MSIFSRKKHVTATIRRIRESPPPGAPWYYWTYVLFEAQGEPIEVRLTKRQAKRFARNYSVGETGHLVYKGRTLVSWETASEAAPLAAGKQVSVFLSYAHEWSDDAAFIAQVFRSRGLDTWFDKEDLRTGDKLDNRVRKGIEDADYLVALLSPEYFASPWCMSELAAAEAAGVEILPIKVSEGELVLPPHIRAFYEEKLGNPVFLDIRRRDPSAKLAGLAEQMLR